MADDRTQAATSVRNPIATGAYQPDSTRASGDTPPDAPAGPPEPLPDVPGYTVTGELARGGMGRVLAATDPVFGREVAIKVLLPAADPADAARRFVREAVVTGRLAHPNIPPVHALGALADASPFLAMKLVRGSTLAELLKARPHPGHDRPRFVGVFEQVCQAVGYAHAQGIVHRDLKPANVMVGEFGEVQVMDWGIALESRGERGEGSEETTSFFPAPHSPLLTAPGATVGTPGYMAPEQARGEPVDARADVFALGGVLCAVLTGHATFRGPSSKEALAKARASDVADAHARLAACGADPELVALATRCLAPDRVDRPADGTAVAAEVAAYRAGVEARLRAAERERAVADARAAEGRKRRRVVLALVAAVSLILAGGAAVGVWQMSEANRQEAKARQDRAVAGEAVVGLLTEAEAALTALDADRAAPFLGQAARRAADAGLADHDARLAAARADLAVLRELDRVDDERWIPAGSRYRDREGIARLWAAALAGYGVVPGTTPPAEAAARVNASHVRAALLTALDGWLAAARSADVRAVLDAIDPDPFAAEVRRCVAAGDRAGLEALAGRPEWESRPANLAQAYAAWSPVPPDIGRAVLARAAAARVDNFRLLMALGVSYPTETPTTAPQRLQWFRAAVAVRPDSPAAHNNLGIALADAGEPAAAVVAYREAMRLSPRLAAPHNNLGVLRWRAGEFPAAAAAFREAIRLDPAYSVPHNGLANVYLREGQPDAAVAEFREAIRLDPKDAVPRNGLGNALRATDDMPGAAAAYREAIRLAPEFAKAHVGLGIALAAQDDADGAEAAFREGVRLDPGDEGAHFNLGNLLRGQNRFREAVASFRAAVRLAPADATNQAALGATLVDLRDYPAAVAPLREAVRFGPGDPATHNSLGVALERLLDLDGAEAAYCEAVRLNPKFGMAHANLGDVYRKRGRHADAVAAYRTGLDLAPGLRFAREGLGYCERVQRGEVPTAPPPRPVTR